MGSETTPNIEILDCLASHFVLAMERYINPQPHGDLIKDPVLRIAEIVNKSISARTMPVNLNGTDCEF